MKTSVAIVAVAASIASAAPLASSTPAAVAAMPTSVTGSDKTKRNDPAEHRPCTDDRIEGDVVECPDDVTFTAVKRGAAPPRIPKAAMHGTVIQWDAEAKPTTKVNSIPKMAMHGTVVNWDADAKPTTKVNSIPKMAMHGTVVNWDAYAQPTTTVNSIPKMAMHGTVVNSNANAKRAAATAVGPTHSDVFMAMPGTVTPTAEETAGWVTNLHDMVMRGTAVRPSLPPKNECPAPTTTITVTVTTSVSRNPTALPTTWGY